MSQDPKPENSTGSPFIIETGTQVWKLYPRDGETVMMKLHFARVMHSSLLACSVSLVSSAQVDISAKTAEDGVLSSDLLLDLFFLLKEGRVRPRNGQQGRCGVCIILEHRNLFKKQIWPDLLEDL